VSRRPVAPLYVVLALLGLLLILYVMSRGVAP
jgi:hypothetical protein